MPSPFPGMDPYLEHPALFPGFHDRFIYNLSEQLQPNLPAPYFADIGDRIWVEQSKRYIGPDVNVLEGKEQTTETAGREAVATLVQTEPVVVHVPHDEIREPFVEIYTRDATERLVTTIEFLSLANKTPGERGRDLYLRKQQEVLNGKVHLVEIDLLRGGTHATAVPHDLALEKTGPFDYHVCIHQFDNLEDYLVYPIRLERNLPVIAIPLLPGDGAVTINLQSVFDRCYETGPYHRRIRYGEDAVMPPLDAGRQAWAGKLIQEFVRKK